VRGVEKRGEEDDDDEEEGRRGRVSGTLKESEGRPPIMRDEIEGTTEVGDILLKSSDLKALAVERDRFDL